MTTETQPKERGIVWPEELSSVDLPRLLQANKSGTSLRVLVAHQVGLEHNGIQFPRRMSKLNTNVILGDYLNVPRTIGEVSDLYKHLQAGGGQEIAQILDAVFSRGRSTLAQDFGFLVQKISNAVEILRPDVRDSIVMQDRFSLADLGDLARILKHVEFLEKDPTGVELADKLVADNRTRGVGFKEGAKRYKELYELLVSNGAITDRKTGLLSS